MRIHDVSIIGVGGVVGSAIARELAQRGFSVIGFERHRSPGAEISGANSQVIHSGFHERPGTLKSRLARDGSVRLIQYAAARGIRTLHTGMLIAVPPGAGKFRLWREAGALWSLWRNGRRYRIPLQWIFSQSGIRRIAPVRAAGGIFIPAVHVIDVRQLITSLQRDAIEAGAELVYHAPVQRIGRQVSLWAIEARGREFHAHALINSAGLSAAEVSRMAGGPAYEVEYYRGEYYELKGGVDRWGIQTLVYPVMPPHSKSKGIHLGPRPDGRLMVGPNAVPLPRRELHTDARTDKAIFLEAARRFLPGISDRDLEWSFAGLRPKYVARNGISDFVIRADNHMPRLINLIGIDSPGLSACMAIAEHVARLLEASGRGAESEATRVPANGP